MRPVYGERYDDYFDDLAGTWSEQPCADLTCHYCRDRPMEVPC